MSMLPSDILSADSTLSHGDGAASDDVEIVARVVAGEVDLFELLMRRHNQRLFRVARAIVKSDDEAEDVMQEAYVNAYTHLSQFAGRAKFSTWLTRIAIHEALARVRKHGRDLEPDAEVMSAEGSSPEEAVSDRELCAILSPMVDALPEAFRVVFVLRAVEELSVEEVADCLALVPETVRTRFFRARRLLQQALLSRGELAEKGIYEFRLQRCDRVVSRVLARIA